MNLGILWFQSPGETFHGRETSEDDSDQKLEITNSPKAASIASI